MKYTSPLHCKIALLSAVSLAVFSAAHANPYNDGSSNTNTTSVTYDEPLYIGIQNPDNTLIITSNATVSASEVIIGQLNSSSNNTVSVIGDARLIAGSGATTNGLATGGVVVGTTDSGAALSIDNGSTLDAEYLYIGRTNNESLAAVAGADSVLYVSKDAYVGTSGSTNSIVISDGGTLQVDGTLTVGAMNQSNNNVTVSDGGALFVNSVSNIIVVNTGETNDVVIEANGTLQVGGDVNTGEMAEQHIDMEDGANLETGGTLTLNRSRIDSSLNVIVNDALSTNTASWSSGSLLAIGNTTDGNSLTFTNGATGHATNIVQLGQTSSSSDNALSIGGSNSTFTADNDVFVGAQGSDNALNITDGAQMTVAETLYVGYNASSEGNTVYVGTNAALTVTGETIIGNNGNENSFTIDGGEVTTTDFILGASSADNDYEMTDGTHTVDGTFIIGKTDDASGETGSVNSDTVKTTGNLAIIGTNSTLTIEEGLTVGLEGSGSIMTIRDGGEVTVNGDVVIGENVGDNYIYLQRDSNTVLNVNGDLIVGKSDEGSNRFAIYGGTANVTGDFLLGVTNSQHETKNFIHLETTNAVLNVAGTLAVGASNSINTLDIVDGATATATDLLVGACEGVSNNVVTITGDKALMAVANSLQIGSATGTNNSVTVEDGGILQVDQDKIILGSGTNNLLTIADGGTLKTGDWNFSALTNTYTNIVLESGATLHMLGELTGTNMVEGGRNFVLDGTNSSWTGTTNLYVGNETDSNSLTITNGAHVLAMSNLYLGALSTNNLLTVGGSGSLLTVGNNLFIGTDTNLTAYNTLEVLDGGMMVVSNDASLFYGANLKIGAASQVSVLGDYTQDEYSTLIFGISSNQVQPNLTVGGSMTLAASANTNRFPTIKVYDEGVSESDNIVTIVQAGSITVDGESATAALLKNNIATNLLLSFNVSVSNSSDYTYIILDDLESRSIGQAGNLNGQLSDIAGAIELLRDAGDDTAVDMATIIADMSDSTEVQEAMDNYYGSKMSSVPAHNVINAGLQSVAEQLTKRADNTRERIAVATPAGAQGPHSDGQELQGWMSGYKSWNSGSAAGGFDGYDGSIRGILIGIDYELAEGILVGAAGGTGSGSIDKDNGGDVDTKTKTGSLYASAGTKDWFADASLIFGLSSVDTTLGSTFDTAGSFDAKNVAVYIGGGKEIIGKYFIVTPQASLLGNYYSQDGYTESATTAVARRIDSFSKFYVQSSIGCNFGFYSTIGETVVKPEFRVHWLHEFNAREEDLNYSLVGAGSDLYSLELQAPEEDIIKLGAGISAKMSEYLELRADLDMRKGSDYSDTSLVGSIRYQF